MQEEANEGISPFEAEPKPTNVLNADGSLFDPTMFDPTELSEPSKPEPVVIQGQPQVEDKPKSDEQVNQTAQVAAEGENGGDKLLQSQNQRSETDKTIYVSNLDHSVRYTDLKRYFSNFGEIDRIRDRKQNDGKYFAFVLYKNVESVNKALMEANGRRFVGGKKLHVALAGKPSIRQAGPVSINQGSIKGQAGNDKSDKDSSYSESDYKNQKETQMRPAIEDRISLRDARDRSDQKERKRENGDKSEHKDRRGRRRSSDEKSRSRSRDRKKRDRRRSNRNSSSRNSSKSSKSESRREKVRKTGRDRENSSHNLAKDKLSGRKDKGSTSRSRDVSRDARKRSRDRDRTRDRDTDRDRERDRQREKEKELEREKERQREKEKAKEREKSKKPSSFNEYKEEYDARSFHKMILNGKLKYPSGSYERDCEQRLYEHLKVAFGYYMKPPN